jgi:hypothetical protein
MTRFVEVRPLADWVELTAIEDDFERLIKINRDLPDALYYERPRSGFFDFEAVIMAVAAKKSLVITRVL